MAQRTQVLLIDDIDGGDATESLTFGLDGTAYEIDLSDKNAAALRKALSKYVEHARRVSSTRPRTAGPSRKGSGSANPPKLVREWAKAQAEFEGKVPDRGRIPQEVQDAYAAAH